MADNPYQELGEKPPAMTSDCLHRSRLEERDSSRDGQRESVYQEAAIFLEEGLGNDKFDNHPKTEKEYMAFRRCHNRIYYTIELLPPLCLMLLALVEKPATIKGLSIWTKCLLEILFMGVIIVLMAMRGMWLGWRRMFRQKRTVMKAVLIAALFVDAFVEMAHDSHHGRFLRALRPLFLFDAHYLAGLRRIMRDIFYSMIPILDMLVLVMFFLTIFSLFGYFLFSGVENDEYFQTFKRSFVQMFVLLTTANHPDIMTVEYDQNPLSPIFFDIFLLIGLYLLLNLFLAVVYGTFGGHEKNKFKKLYLHKRASLIRAFNVIVKKSTRVMKYDQFEKLMAHFKPGMDRVEVTCCFKALSSADSGSIKLLDFLNLFQFCDMHWAHIKKGREQGRWYDMKGCPFILSKCGKVAGQIVEHKYFSRLVGLVLISNLVALLFEAVYTTDPIGQSAKFDNVDYLFLTLYCVELGLKMFGLGPMMFFRDFWNWFDLIIVVVSIVGQIGDRSLATFVFLRPLRLIRLFAFRKRYRDILFTLWVVMPRMSHMLMLLANIYYFFAIIGMEVFAGKMEMGVFDNETDSYLTSYYSGEKTGRYHNINFDNLLRSYQTLFVLTVVNNWFIIMRLIKDAYAKLCGELARAYFMIFYLVILVILTIVVSFILDAFTAIDNEQKQAAESQEKVGTSKKLTLTLTAEELLQSPSPNPDNNIFVYVGKRRRTKDDLSLKLYADDIPDWIAEYDDEVKRLGTLDVDKLQLKRPKSTASSDRNSLADTSLDIM